MTGKSYEGIFKDDGNNLYLPLLGIDVADST